MKRKVLNKKLVLNQETLRKLTPEELKPVIGLISMVSVCHENTKPECYLSAPDC
ncbi:MAG TPA: class I lanthipeptide [Thermoanaerobaculia bacterium]|jgi:hypothetical protein|nr:class I lanthipeptide [Thermoanaerobaculia bacterium]